LAAVIAIEFSFPRIGRSLGELLSKVADWAARCRTVDPLSYPWHAGDALLDEHADTAAGRLTFDPLPPSPVVVGQCTGVLFALAIAERGFLAAQRPHRTIRPGCPVHVVGAVLNGTPDSIAEVVDGALEPSLPVDSSSVDAEQLAALIDHLS
jgi:hypothetical protein